MKKFFFLITLTIVVSFFWLTSDFHNFSRDDYLTKKILDNSVPFDVKIDTEFLQSLKPANE